MGLCVDFDNGKKTLRLIIGLRSFIHDIGLIGSMIISQLIGRMSSHVSNKLIFGYYRHCFLLVIIFSMQNLVFVKNFIQVFLHLFKFYQFVFSFRIWLWENFFFKIFWLTWKIFNLLDPTLFDSRVFLTKSSKFHITLNKFLTYPSVWINRMLNYIFTFLPAVKRIFEGIDHCFGEHLWEDNPCTCLFVFRNTKSWLTKRYLPDFSAAVVRK